MFVDINNMYKLYFQFSLSKWKAVVISVLQKIDPAVY